MPMNKPKEVFGDLVLKCQLGKPFDKLRSIMKKENIDGLFKKSCFAHFLELSGTCPFYFPMIMVYGLLKHRIMYAGDYEGPNEGRKKMDEIWINYCGMLVCFGLKEFTIVTGLRCDRPEEPPINYYLTVKYLLKELKSKTTTLYGFPWDLMAWACEAIPFLLKHFTDYPDKVVHPWIVPTIDELGMAFFLTLGLVDTKEDPTVEVIKKELDGATSIRRAVRQGQSNVQAFHDKTQTATDPGASSGGVAGEVVCDGGSHPAAASAASHDYEHVGAQQKINMFKNTPCTGMLVHLRCLRIQMQAKTLPPSFSNLCNLETLEVRNNGSSNMVLSPTIWSLSKLRHVDIKTCSVFDSDIDKPTKLENLTSLKFLKLSCSVDSEDIFKRFPNLRNLQFHINCSAAEQIYFPRLDVLNKLESVNASFKCFLHTHAYQFDFHFPLSLKEVILYGFDLTSDALSRIGRSLPNLQKLDLIRARIHFGNEWNMERVTESQIAEILISVWKNPRLKESALKIKEYVEEIVGEDKLEMSSSGRAGGVGVPHRWVKGSLVSLYGLGQSSPHELAELGPRPILTSHNFSTWKAQIFMLMCGHYLFGHLDGYSPTPSTITTQNGREIENPAYSVWFHQDQLIQNAIMASVRSDD
ncbi:putative cycloartenol synthase-like [Capsicum annuum]|nr:putative cycloartenol synthase-like [Capsicum annuum]